MLKAITLENFFSFGTATTVHLSHGANMLMGINGSGKSNFIRAIRLLHEAVHGQGFERLFLGSWGGFPAVVNYTAARGPHISLRFTFDKDRLGQSLNGSAFLFPQDPVYTLAVYPEGGGGGYYLQEAITCQGPAQPTPFKY